MGLGRILCLFGWHDWKFTLNFIQPPDYDMPCGAHYGSNHYSGECRRGCGERNLFRGPYRPEEAVLLASDKTMSSQERNQ